MEWSPFFLFYVERNRVLVNWKRIPLFKSALPSERIAGSIRSGLRYVRYAPDLQSSLVRAFIYTFFISAIWSLLAVVAKRDLKQGPLGYGILNGSLGLGAVIAATTLHRIRQRFSADQILATSTLYNVVVLLVMAFVRSPSPRALPGAHSHQAPYPAAAGPANCALR